MRPQLLVLAAEDRARLSFAARLAAVMAFAFVLLLLIAASSRADTVTAAASPSDVLDLSGLIQPVLQVAALVILALVARWVPRLSDAMEARTGVHLTDQQRQTLLGAVKTGAGVVETLIDQGALRVAHVTVTNPAILMQARQVIAAVPAAASALGVTEAGVARMIVGAVDTGSRSVTPATSAATQGAAGVTQSGTGAAPLAPRVTWGDPAVGQTQAQSKT